MTADDIVTISLTAPVILGIAGFLVHALVDETEDKLWPRGLRWFPGAALDLGEALHKAMLRIFWPERRHAFRGRELLRLEALDRDWRTWARSSDGGIPRWDPDLFRGRGSWRPRGPSRLTCPCGYADECAVHCGSGHANGMCPGAHGPGVRYER